jgi:hypothetical protein
MKAIELLKKHDILRYFFKLFLAIVAVAIFTMIMSAAWFPNEAEAAVIYERTPADQNILVENNPVSFSVSFDAADFEQTYDFLIVNSWPTWIDFFYTGVEGSGFSDINRSGNCLPLQEFGNTLSDTYTFPVGGIEGVGINLYDSDTCEQAQSSVLLEWNGGNPNYAFSIINEIPPPPPPPPPPTVYIPPRIDLMGSTSLLDVAGGSMIAGVQATGSSIWGLLPLLGVVLAFIIALQLATFTRRTIGTTSEKGGKIADEYGPDHPDYKAYKRGRSIIEKENPTMYDKD